MLEKISQKQAVITATLNELGVSYNIAIPVRDILTKGQIECIRGAIFVGIKNKTIAFNKVFDDAKLKVYISSMVSNHFRKALELNGVNKYTPKEFNTNLSKNKHSIDVTLLPNDLKEAIVG